MDQIFCVYFFAVEQRFYHEATEKLLINLINHNVSLTSFESDGFDVFIKFSSLNLSHIYFGTRLAGNNFFYSFNF